MFKNRSKFLFASSLLLIIYVTYWIMVFGSVSGSDESGSGAIGWILIFGFYHFLLMIINIPLSIAAFFSRETGLIIICIIAYVLAAISIVSTIPYILIFEICIISITLLGLKNQKKINLTLNQKKKF